jgi:uncharacterized protein YkwD
MILYLIGKMTLTQPIITDPLQTKITSYINAYRARHQAPPLTWDNTIAAFSSQWAYGMNSKKSFQHSGTNLYGENIAYLQGYGSLLETLLKKAIDLWYNEVSLYDYTNPAFSSATGHFTCLVWKSSTKYGIGLSMDTNTNEVYICFNTSPPGNYIGQFSANVSPAITIPSSLPSPMPESTTPILPTTNPAPIIPTTPIQPSVTYIKINKTKICTNVNCTYFFMTF